jgi:hypothetical protein
MEDKKISRIENICGKRKDLRNCKMTFRCLLYSIIRAPCLIFYFYLAGYNILTTSLLMSSILYFLIDVWIRTERAAVTTYCSDIGTRSAATGSVYTCWVVAPPSLCTGSTGSPHSTCRPRPGPPQRHAPTRTPPLTW